MYWILVLLLTACTPSATSTKSSADSASDATASTAATQGQSHTETGKTDAIVPIMVNCIQVYVNDPHVKVGPCIMREGANLPGDKEATSLK